MKEHAKIQAFLAKSLFFISLLTLAPCQANDLANGDFSGDSGGYPAQSNPGMTTPSELQATDGPLLNERQAFIQRLKQAKQLGVGIGPYASEFGNIQNSITPDNSQAYSQRLQSLRTNLESQIKRSTYFKTQRPSQISAPGGDIPPPPQPGTDLSATGRPPLPIPIDPQSGDGMLLNKIKERLGGQLPSNWQDKINSKEGQAILKRLQGN